MSVPNKFDLIKSELEASFDSGDAPVLTVFGSARVQPNSELYQCATKLTNRLAERYTILTGGGPGLMQAAAEGQKSCENPAGKSDAVAISLPFEEEPNPHLDTVHTMEYFFTRKLQLINRADAFLVLPGGWGTMDEISEVITLIQCKKIKRKPIMFYNYEGYWSTFFKHIDTQMEYGMSKYTDLADIAITDDIDEICGVLLQAKLNSK